MITKECQEKTSVSRVKVSELTKKATFVNDEGDEYIKTKVDGCIVCNSSAADWVVSKQNIGDVIIELKGRDVEHAVKQISATADMWHSNNIRAGRMAALIVSRQCPKATTTIQRAQNNFRKNYRGPLHIVTGNYEYSFDNVLSFKGPHKKD